MISTLRRHSAPQGFCLVNESLRLRQDFLNPTLRRSLSPVVARVKVIERRVLARGTR